MTDGSSILLTIGLFRAAGPLTANFIGSAIDIQEGKEDWNASEFSCIVPGMIVGRARSFGGPDYRVREGQKEEVAMKKVAVAAWVITVFAMILPHSNAFAGRLKVVAVGGGNYDILISWNPFSKLSNSYLIDYQEHMVLRDGETREINLGEYSIHSIGVAKDGLWSREPPGGGVSITPNTPRTDYCPEFIPSGIPAPTRNFTVRLSRYEQCFCRFSEP